MGLESTIVCLDTSEFMRNGDYHPTRLAAQQDAVNLVTGSKLRSNPETVVGLLTHGGKGVKLLSSPTDDSSKLYAVLHGLTVGGTSHIVEAIKVSMLALRHRRNRHGAQRIVIFIGSPVSATDKELKKLGDQLRKNNVFLDIIGIGENEANSEKLQRLVDVVNDNGSSSGSHFVAIPAGVIPSDVLVSSPVILGDDAVAGGAAGGLGDFGAADAGMDPDLAAAIRASMEDARQSAISGDVDASAAAADAGFDLNDEEALLQRALELSVGTASGAESAAAPAPAPAPASETAPAPAATPAPAPATAATSTESAAADAAAPASSDAASAAASASAAAGEATFLDPAFVSNLLGSLDNVDLNDPSIQAAMAQITGGATDSKADDKDKDKDGEGGDGAGK